MRLTVTGVVSDEGTVVVFEGVTDEDDVHKFAVDHRCAQGLVDGLAGDDLVEVDVESWQVLS